MKNIKGMFKRAFKVERKVIDFLSENIIFIYFAAACTLALIIRIGFLDTLSGDYNSFLKPWFDEIDAGGGFSTLNKTIGNYNVLYMYFFTALTYLPINSLYSIKLLSILFDILCAAGCALTVYQLCGRTKKAHYKALAVFTVVLMLPTVILNSSAWAQCDSAYTACAVFSIYYLIKQKYVPAMIWFSLSFCFKLQAIFILPLFIIVYFTEKKFSVVTFFIIPIICFLCAVPALICGRPLNDIINIYIGQINQYKSLTLNYPNIYKFIPDDYDLFNKAGILMAVFIFGCMATFIIIKKYHITGKRIISLSLWSVMVCVLFLPAMHERYAYMADILSVVYFFVMNKKIIIPITVNLVSLMAYYPFLFRTHMIDMKILAAVNIAIFVVITKELFIDLKKKPFIKGVVSKGKIKLKNKIYSIM